MQLNFQVVYSNTGGGQYSLPHEVKNCKLINDKNCSIELIDTRCPTSKAVNLLKVEALKGIFSNPPQNGLCFFYTTLSRQCIPAAP